jgi:hypothetical protein
LKNSNTPHPFREYEVKLAKSNTYLKIIVISGAFFYFRTFYIKFIDKQFYLILGLIYLEVLKEQNLEKAPKVS